jgi:hypothetical protein
VTAKGYFFFFLTVFFFAFFAFLAMLPSTIPELVQCRSTSTCTNIEYTTIAELILRASKKVNGGHAMRLSARTNHSLTRWRSAGPHICLSSAVGTVAAIGGWCPEYAKATFQARFPERKDIGMPDHVEAILRALGKSADDVVAQSQAPGTERRFKTVTAAARQLGIFGSPSFALAHEIFWGDDRREEAIACAAGVKWPAVTPKPAPVGVGKAMRPHEPSHSTSTDGFWSIPGATFHFVS